MIFNGDKDLFVLQMNRKSIRKSLSNVFKKTEDTHTWGPLLITVGPNLCGKTSFVKSLDENVFEVATENASELYDKVAVDLVLKVWQDKVSGDVVQTLRSHTQYNVPMLDRLKAMKSVEISLIAQLFAKLITFKDFEAKMTTFLIDEDYGDIFIGCVRELYHSKGIVLKTKTFDIFIGEAVETATTNAKAAMKAAIKTNPGVICWGNTNLNPDFYKDALKVADKYQRVVRFVRWGKEIPVVPLKELFRRSILQFLETGRYVSSSKMAKFRHYAELFVAKANSNTHIDFATIAGYDMNDIGCVSDKAQPLSKKSNAHSNSNRYSVWTNDGLVFNIVNGPPTSPSNVNRAMSKSNSANGGISSQNSSDNEIEAKDNSVRRGSRSDTASPRVKTPSAAGSVTGSVASITFGAAATKTMHNRIPSDPNVIALSESALKAANEKNSKLSGSDRISSAAVVATNDSAANSSKFESDEASPVSNASELDESSTVNRRNSKNVTINPSAPPMEEPSAPPASGVAENPTVKSQVSLLGLFGISSQPSPSAAPLQKSKSKEVGGRGTPTSSPSRQHSGSASLPPPSPKTGHGSNGGKEFTLMGLFGLKEPAKDADELSADGNGAAKFVIDTHTPTTEPHVHTSDHKVFLQDSVKLTHIHKDAPIQKEKSIGHAADLRKSNSGHVTGTAAAVAITSDKSEGIEPESAVSPAKFIIDDEPVIHGIAHQHSLNHEVHLQDSVKLAHLHEEEKVVHRSASQDDGHVGHPKDHKKHPIFIEPKREGSTDSEIGFASTKSAQFVLDEHSPRLTHQKSENGEVLLQDSVKLTHIHKTQSHDKPLFNPVIVRNDSFELKDPQTLEKKVHPPPSSPPQRKLSFKVSLVEEIPNESEQNTPVENKATPRSAAAALFASVPVDSKEESPVAARFVLDDKSPTSSEHYHVHKNHQVHIQDSVKLAHIHENKSHESSNHNVHMVKIELTPEQNRNQPEKHIAFKPTVTPIGSPAPPKDGLLAAQQQRDVESSEDDETIIRVLTSPAANPSTPKQSPNSNPFACVFPDLFCRSENSSQK